MHIADGIERLTQGVSNFYVVEEGGRVVIVDAGTPSDWPRLGEALEALGRSLSDVEAVLLTHAHADHTGFAEQARTEAGAEIWVHDEDAEAARTGRLEKNEGKMRSYLFRSELYRTFWTLGRAGASKVVPVAEVSTFADGELVDVPGKPRVLHAPGHTRGCAALFFEERGTLFSGDTIVTRNPMTGRIGPQIMPSGMNLDSRQALESLGAFEGVRAERLLPGHGEPWTAPVEEAVHRARAAGIS
jgi:glyoxylase-like metal-dependent hydrolase (beta-lactamase superfamily II)